MRKVRAADIKREFSTQADRMIAYIGRVSLALAGSARAKGDISRLCESVFLDAFVVFEWFISDLFLAYMNDDFTPYQTDLAQRISQSISKGFGRWAESRTKYDPIRHLPVDKIEEIVDPESRIITFSHSDKMIEKSRRWLAPKYSLGITSLNDADRILLDAARSIRNYIAHGSESAWVEMNEYLANIDKGPPNEGLGRGQNKINDIGSFLKAQLPEGKRVEKYIKRMVSISGQM